MGIFILEKEAERLKKASENSEQKQFYQALKNRVIKNTVKDSLVQPADTQEWYHLCWERFSDAAFLYYMERSSKLGTWIHDRTMEIVNMSQDEWIGPWYRERLRIPQGFLETSHITLAICEAADNCKELFSDTEYQRILNALRNKGMIPCMRYCKRIMEQQDHINNWFMVALNGFGTAAILLNDEALMKKAVQWSRVAGSLYSADDYGESVQYSNYATLHYSHLCELLIRTGKADTADVDMFSYTNIMDWYAASFLYLKPLKEGGEIQPRTINFGDSAALFRPSGDVLTHVAVRMKEKAPRQAGLASWMLKTLYSKPEAGPDELASFGMYNQFQYHTILMLPDMADPLSPAETGLPVSMHFDGGQIILRDCWEQARAVAAIQAGYKPYNVTSHRHKDQNSFQLVVGSERMLIDPGHCCYRLNAQKEAVSECSHNNFTIKKGGSPIEQQTVGGNVFRRQEPGNHLICNDRWGRIQIVISDMAGLYGEEIKKAVRIWIVDLPYKMYVADVVIAKEPVSLCTHFNVNNRDNRLQVCRDSNQRIIFQRGNQVMELFEVYSKTDGLEKPAVHSFNWTAMHNYYHPLPNQEGQGKDGSVNQYLWEDEEGREHIRIHTLVMYEKEKAVKWEICRTEDGFMRTVSRKQDSWLDIKVEADKIELRSRYGNETRRF
ncbi:MAG: heparinase II/III family protein [Clostridiaceae bacterium]|nr:heparinase II/III family protein [Clostridiaceae bacterium]